MEGGFGERLAEEKGAGKKPGCANGKTRKSEIYSIPSWETFAGLDFWRAFVPPVGYMIRLLVQGRIGGRRVGDMVLLFFLHVLEIPSHDDDRYESEAK